MSWKKVKLGELCIIEKGSIGIKKAIPGDYPLVVTSEDRKSHNEFQFDEEAVIIPLVSSTGHGHKSLRRIHYQTGKFALGSILCAVIPKDKTILNAEYLFRYLDLNKEDELVSRMKGMANVTLPIKEIAQIEIPIPSIEEQRKFVEAFSELENNNEFLSTELSHQLSLVKKLRQQFLQDAVQGKLLSELGEKGLKDDKIKTHILQSNNPKNHNSDNGHELLKKIKAALRQAQGDKKGKKQKELPPIKPEEIPFEIPENWVWCRLGEVCTKIGSGSTPKGSNYSENGFPFFRSQNVYNEGLIYQDIKYISDEVQKQMNGTIVFANDILLNITGGSMGRCTLVPLDFEEGNVSQHVCIIRPIEINNKFLHSIILSPFFQNFIFSSTTGAGREVCRPEIYLQFFVYNPTIVLHLIFIFVLSY